MKTTSKKEDNLKNEDNLHNEDDVKNEDDIGIIIFMGQVSFQKGFP